MGGPFVRLQGTPCVVDKVLLGHCIIRGLRFLVVSGNAVGIVNRLHCGCPRVRGSVPDRNEILYSETSRSNVQPTQRPVQETPDAASLEVQLPGQVDHRNRSKY